MRCLVFSFGLFFLLIKTPIFGQGLIPFSPPPDARVSNELRESPNLLSPLIRPLTATDKVYVLRSLPPMEESGVLTSWYEVDVFTTENLNFRGWLKANWPKPERAAQPEAKPEQAKRDPWKSKQWQWLWSPDVEERIQVGLNGGLMTTSYQLSGIVSGARTEIYSYEFTGFSLGPEVRMKLVQWSNPTLKVDGFFRARYDYGQFGLAFSPQFEVSELAGRAYELSTHTYRLEGRARLEPRVWKNMPIRLRANLGAGFWYHETIPNLERITTGSFAGQSIFVNTVFKALSLPVEVEGLIYQDWRARLAFSLFLLGSMKETGTQTPALEPTGFPFVLEGSVAWSFYESWAGTLSVDYFSVAGKSSGTGTRLNSTYTEGRLSLNYLRIHGGLEYQF